MFWVLIVLVCATFGFIRDPWFKTATNYAPERGYPWDGCNSTTVLGHSFCTQGDNSKIDHCSCRNGTVEDYCNFDHQCGSEQSTAWSCGDPIYQCGTSCDGDFMCVCDRDINNNSVCWQDTYCNYLAQCESPNDCLQDEVCVQTCCGCDPSSNDPSTLNYRCLKKCDNPWEEPELVGPNPPCTECDTDPWVCPDPTAPCPAGEGDCYCIKSSTGPFPMFTKAYCLDDEYCKSSPICQTVADCPDGPRNYKCVPNNCCDDGEKHCLPCCADGTPSPTEKPIPEPTPQPSASPIPAPTPEPTPHPTPQQQDCPCEDGGNCHSWGPFTWNSMCWDSPNEQCDCIETWHFNTFNNWVVDRTRCLTTTGFDVTTCPMATPVRCNPGAGGGCPAGFHCVETCCPKNNDKWRCLPCCSFAP